MAGSIRASAMTEGALWGDARRRLRGNRAAIAAAAFIAVLVLAALLGPLASPYAVDHVDWTLSPLASPPSLSNGHWFGTDSNGRDLFVRVWTGTQVSLLVALLATAVSVVIGVAWGATAGYLGGRVDGWMMRVVDVLYALPYMFFVIILTVVFGRSLWLIFLAIGAVGWLTMARIVRGQALALRQREFVLAAVALGLPARRIIARHVVPNVLGTVIVYATLTVPAGDPVRELPELPRPRRAGAAHQPRPAGGGGRARDGDRSLATAGARFGARTAAARA